MKERLAIGLAFVRAEMTNIDAYVPRIPLASRARVVRAAIHYGLQYLQGMDDAEAARKIQEFEALRAEDRFKKC